MAQSFQEYDIADELWELLSPHLPGQAGQWGRVAKDNRRFVNAVLWILRTGAPWRDLPPEYGSWNTVQRRFCRWRDKGIWEKLLELLIDEPEYEWLMVGPKAHSRGTEAKDHSKPGSRAKRSPRYAWPWIRMICRSENLARELPRRIIGRLVEHKGNVALK